MGALSSIENRDAVKKRADALQNSREISDKMFVACIERCHKIVVGSPGSGIVDMSL